MSGNILAIDQGTTNTKALVVSPTGAILARGSQPTAIRYPQPGWVEQDALEVWRGTRAAIAECLSALDKPDLSAVAITNQRETAVVWERATGKPVGPCVVWQCRRSAPFCNQLKAQGHAPLLRERTGLQVDPMFSASKLRWLLDHTEDGLRRAEQGELCAGNMDAWVLWNLTGGAVHATDMTNASRTQLLNLHTLAWDEAALALFGIPSAALPEIKPSSAFYGETAPLDELPGGIPIAAMIGDSHAALYGQAGFKPGSIKATYGTGSSLMTPTTRATLSLNGLSTTVAWAREKATGSHKTATYALEGNIYATGAAVQWLGQVLGLADPGPDIEKLARTVADAAGVVFVPALVGLGAPHWQEAARGLITGLTPGVGAGQLARATLEAIAYQVRDVFDVMQAESGAPLQTLLADGGASRNDLLMQFQADILNCPVLRSTSTEISPLGAAFLAGLAVGVWADETEIENLVPPRDRFEPQMSAERRAALYAGWQEAVARTVLDPGINGAKL
ncbi:MAG: glycerol kinase [Anaerolineae bacterium]|nr:glycerol kinase [Anaerolineae bacterium]